MALSVEETAKINALNALVFAGQPVSLEQLREGVSILRGNRVGAQIASTRSRSEKAKAAAPIDADAALKALMGNAADLKGGLL